MAIHGKTALVTGDSRGIGAATAIQANISDSAAVRDMFAAATDALGRLDIVVASAGVELIDVPFTDYTEQQYDRVSAVNVKGTSLTLQKAARTVTDGRRIIVISSNTTRLSLPGFAVYGASKLAPHYFVQVLAKEFGPRQVTVNTVIPSATLTAGMFTTSHDEPIAGQLAAQTRLGRLGTPQDTAKVVAFLAGDAAGFITGQQITVDGGAAI